jgi:peptidoglycan/LPS O-acetylase OafA/YrhL
MSKHSVQPDVLNLTDFCKGVAISLIVLNHYQQGWFGWQGVHIFIVMSGFGLTYSCLKKSENPQSKAWYFKRTAKLLPAYWSVVFCLLLLGLGKRIFSSDSLSQGLVDSLNLLAKHLFLNFLLLRNFLDGFFYDAPASFWFIPFIVSFYLFFPVLFNYLKKDLSVNGCIKILMVAMVIEFIYRTLSIYCLDGLPVGYDQKFLSFIPDSVFALNHVPEALNHVPENIWGIPVPLQGKSLFGFFPARFAEFTLGSLCAVAVIRDRKLLNERILNIYTGLIGLLIWGFGQFLLHIDLWGWIFADFVIALGLVLLLLNLACFFQNKASVFFQLFTWLGVSSYYIYLTHQPIIQIFHPIETKLFKIIEGGNVAYFVLKFILFGILLASIYVASWIVMRFERANTFQKL